MPRDFYAGAYLGTCVTVGDLKQRLAEDQKRSEAAADPGIELTQIDMQLSERAAVIAKEQKIPFGDAFKRATHEKPEMLTRRNLLTARSRQRGSL